MPGFLTKKLGTTAQATIILEDSNHGIAAAKAAGAYTIGFSHRKTYQAYFYLSPGLTSMIR